MASMNKVIIAGNLTRDVEMRRTNSGASVANFGVAINRKYKDQSGQYVDDTTFVDIQAWQKTAELCSEYLQKGSPVLIEARLKTESWQDSQSGQNRYKLVLVAENVQFLSSGQQNQQQGGYQQQPQQGYNQNQGYQQPQQPPPSW